MALLSNLNSPPFWKWRAQIITPNPPLKSTWPSWDHRDRQRRGRREQLLSLPFAARAPCMLHNDGRTDGRRTSDVGCGDADRTGGRGRSIPPFDRSLVASWASRGAHMPSHSPPTDHRMTRDLRWIQLTKRITQEVRAHNRIPKTLLDKEKSEWAKST